MRTVLQVHVGWCWSRRMGDIWLQSLSRSAESWCWFQCLCWCSFRFSSSFFTHWLSIGYLWIKFSLNGTFAWDHATHINKLCLANFSMYGPTAMLISFPQFPSDSHSIFPFASPFTGCFKELFTVKCFSGNGNTRNLTTWWLGWKIVEIVVLCCTSVDFSSSSAGCSNTKQAADVTIATHCCRCCTSNSFFGIIKTFSTTTQSHPCYNCFMFYEIRWRNGQMNNKKWTKQATTLWRILNFHICTWLNKRNKMLRRRITMHLLYMLCWGCYKIYSTIICTAMLKHPKIKSQTQPKSAHFHIECEVECLSVGTTGHIFVVIFSVGVYSIINCCFPKLFPLLGVMRGERNMLFVCAHKFVQINSY